MLADPRCNICGSVMKPEPEDSEERYIATEDVAFPDRPTQEAHCPRCGHRETVDPEVLLPPLCPACSAPMEWGSVSDPPDSSPNNPLIEAVSRIADLSSQLETGGGQQ
jgi:hypothetical protein